MLGTFEQRGIDADRAHGLREEPVRRCGVAQGEVREAAVKCVARALGRGPREGFVLEGDQPRGRFRVATRAQIFHRGTQRRPARAAGDRREPRCEPAHGGRVGLRSPQLLENLARGRRGVELARASGASRRRAMLKFLKSLFSGTPDYTPNPAASPQQKRALACGAVLAHINDDQHEWLHGNTPDNVSKSQVQAVLGGAWSIESRESLLETLGWLEAEGHRAEYERIRSLLETKGEFKQDASELLRDDPASANISAEDMVAFRNHANGMLEFWKAHRTILGWDLARAISLCRWGAVAGYLTDDEAWQRIEGYSGRLRESLGSWKELGENYVAGFNFWSEDEDDEVRSAVEALLDPSNANSPWLLNRW